MPQSFDVILCDGKSFVVIGDEWQQRAAPVVIQTEATLRSDVMVVLDADLAEMGLPPGVYVVRLGNLQPVGDGAVVGRCSPPLKVRIGATARRSDESLHLESKYRAPDARVALALGCAQVRRHGAG